MKPNCTKYISIYYAFACETTNKHCVSAGGPNNILVINLLEKQSPAHAKYYLVPPLIRSGQE